MNVIIWNSAVSKSTDPIVAGAAQAHIQKRQGSPESAFLALGFFFKEFMLHAFSISLVCTGAFQGGSAVPWKEAVKLSCVMLPSRYTLCVVMAAIVNLCILWMFAAWFILLQLCKSWARVNFFWLFGTGTFLRSSLGMGKGTSAYFLHCGTVPRGNSLLSAKLVDIHSFSVFCFPILTNFWPQICFANMERL